MTHRLPKLLEALPHISRIDLLDACTLILLEGKDGALNGPNRVSGDETATVIIAHQWMREMVEEAIAAIPPGENEETADVD